ncbi:dienelactone hydrolase family protein [Azospirillum sp. SYSU D00513]|uniref:dienelactone hydrolase family protein n=1 Tax=Azospirillum sp. SYSU D00513 TaxID=2812561 RepID=UPI001A95737D|nr:dienelactone hydrolase family protein [Azospirillum sp. SYSU D00513]
METEVHIPPLGLPGTLTLPEGFRAAVLFAHGCGSSRLSPRNRHVAAGLRRAGFATLLIDLLTEEEMQDPANVFDVHRQSDRLLQAIRYLRAETPVERMPVGLYGASSGAATALMAAARAAEHDGVEAVVCRGGRPDLAEEWLEGVAAPTLLIAGGRDGPAIAINTRAFEQLHCAKALEVIPGAGRLFEEPGKLDTVTDSARSWFATHLLKVDA